MNENFEVENKNQNQPPLTPESRMEPIIVPIEPDFVLSPNVCYGSKTTGIYFRRGDDTFGRITFDNLDSLRVSQGEHRPFDDAPEAEILSEYRIWVYRIRPSAWLLERYGYEKKNYGSCYGLFGGNVDEMLSEFSHYCFCFHDEFVEAIARGFWYEESENDLMGMPLSSGHPFLSLEELNVKHHEANGHPYKVVYNPLSTEQILANLELCPQPLYEIHYKFKDEYSLLWTCRLLKRNGRVISVIETASKPELEKEGIVEFEEIRELFETHLTDLRKRQIDRGLG